VREVSVRDRTFAVRRGHLFEVSYVQRGVTQLATVDAADDDVTCGCGETCVHVPVLEEIVLPPSRPTTVGVLSIDRQGLVLMARRRGGLPGHAR